MTIRNPSMHTDDTRLTTLEKARELCLPFLPLAAVVAAALADKPLLTAAAAMLLFVFTIRLAHDLHHNALRLPAWMNHTALALTSLILLSSMHAARLVHLKHHKTPMADDDLEGQPGRHGFFKALVLGMVAVPRLHAQGLRLAGNNSQKSAIRMEIAAALLMTGLWCAAGLLLEKPFWIIPLAIAAAHLFSPMVSVWALHHGLHGSGALARTQDGKLFHTLTLGLMYHLEHHTHPAVPTCRLGRVARHMREQLKPEQRPQIIPVLKHGCKNPPQREPDPIARLNQTRRPRAA